MNSNTTLNPVTNAMRQIIVLIACISIAGALCAQDHQPLEKAQKAARLIHRKATALDDVQIRTDVDLEKPYLVTGSDNLGALALPDKGLKNKAPLKLDGKPLPIGQLWMRGLSPMTGGSKVADGKLREITISTDEEDVDLTVYLLAAVSKDETPMLQIFGAARKPIATLKLKKAKTLQKLPLELDAIGDDGSATLFFNVAGQYVAEMKITKK